MSQPESDGYTAEKPTIMEDKSLTTCLCPEGDKGYHRHECRQAWETALRAELNIWGEAFSQDKPFVQNLLSDAVLGEPVGSAIATKVRALVERVQVLERLAKTIAPLRQSGPGLFIECIVCGGSGYTHWDEGRNPEHEPNCPWMEWRALDGRRLVDGWREDHNQAVEEHWYSMLVGVVGACEMLVTAVKSRDLEAANAAMVLVKNDGKLIDEEQARRGHGETNGAPDAKECFRCGGTGIDPVFERAGAEGATDE